MKKSRKYKKYIRKQIKKESQTQRVGTRNI